MHIFTWKQIVIYLLLTSACSKGAYLNLSIPISLTTNPLKSPGFEKCILYRIINMSLADTLPDSYKNIAFPRNELDQNLEIGTIYQIYFIYKNYFKTSCHHVIYFCIRNALSQCLSKFWESVLFFQNWGRLFKYYSTEINKTPIIFWGHIVLKY